MRVLFLLTVLAGTGLADTLTLRDGRVIEGTFAGGDDRQVRMTSGGKVESFDVSAVARLEFSVPPPPPAAQAVAGSTGTLNGIAALVAIVAAAPNVEKAPEFVPNPFMTLPAAAQPKTK